MRLIQLRPILLPCALTTLMLAACDREPSTSQPAPAPAQATTPTVDWQGTVDAFIQGYFEHNPTDAANAGKHEYDGRLPDWSKAGLQANSDWLHTQRNTIAGISDDV